MPLYEYQCDDCNHEMEVIQKFSDSDLTTCPECNGSIRRLTSQSAFVLKGGGWYKEGYSKSKSSDKASKKSGSGEKVA